MSRRARVVVEVQGCFWHSCPRHATSPKANAEWWEQKLAANRRRDRDTAQRLNDAGRQLVLVWEHEDPVDAAERVAAVVRTSHRGLGPKRGKNQPQWRFQNMFQFRVGTLWARNSGVETDRQSLCPTTRIYPVVGTDVDPVTSCF